MPKNQEHARQDNDAASRTLARIGFWLIAIVVIGWLIFTLLEARS